MKNIKSQFSDENWYNKSINDEHDLVLLNRHDSDHYDRRYREV